MRPWLLLLPPGGRGHAVFPLEQLGALFPGDPCLGTYGAVELGAVWPALLRSPPCLVQGGWAQPR